MRHKAGAPVTSTLAPPTPVCVAQKGEGEMSDNWESVFSRWVRLFQNDGRS